MKKMKSRILVGVLTLAMALCMIPQTASAASGTVSINGVILNSTTPYYSNGGTTYYTEPAIWNAYLDVATSTLHLNGLNYTSTNQDPINVAGFSNLYIELKGTNNKAEVHPDYGIGNAIEASGTNLVIYGDGSLSAKATATDKVAIKAQSITLQYPAELTVEGPTMATSVQVKYSFDTYKVPTAASNQPINDYRSNTDRFSTEPHVHFEPKSESDAKFPVWVGDTRIDGSYFNGKEVRPGTVKYTYAKGSAPAILELNDINVTGFHSFDGDAAAGIYADEDLLVKLSGKNTVLTQYSDDIIAGVYSSKALTFEAALGATLNTSARGSMVANYAVYANEGITLADGCRILDPIDASLPASPNNKFIVKDTEACAAAVIGKPPVTAVTVSPATAIVEKGKTKNFTAAVTGEYSPAQTVTWSVEGGHTGTTIDASGKLTVAASETATALTVRATSTEDTAKSGTATVTITTSAAIKASLTDNPDTGDNSPLMLWLCMGLMVVTGITAGTVMYRRRRA